VYSEPGRGSTFKVYLPQVAAEAGESDAGAAPLAAEGSGTVLLVEDEAVVASSPPACSAQPATSSWWHRRPRGPAREPGARGPFTSCSPT